MLPSRASRPCGCVHPGLGELFGRIGEGIAVAGSAPGPARLSGPDMLPSRARSAVPLRASGPA
jgi:hypothetical protein